MANVKILVVDDEPNILNLVTAYLRPEGYEVYTAADGPSALKAVRFHKPDLIVLDIMLPGMDGLEVLDRIRRTSNVYVIMLTARTEEIDKIDGLSVGADDYITKPFSPRELIARIKAALRRIRADENPTTDNKNITFRRINIDVSARTVTLEGHMITLTAIEFDLLEFLAENHGHVLTRERLMERVWATEFPINTRVVDVHVGNLRKKLDVDGLITTVRGYGYRFEEERA